MATGPLSFSTTENLRKKLLAKNLEPYFVQGSTSPKVNIQDVGIKETDWIELPLVNQEDLDKSGITPQLKLNVLNQFGPQGGRGLSAVFKNLGTKSNQGEFDYLTDNTNKFIESQQEQKELLVLNRFAPQAGWTDAASELEPKIIQPQIRDEYVSDSLKPNLFRPSSYSSAEIYLNNNPTGSDGSLSQDSILAQLGARRLKQLFIDSVAFEIRQRTTGRANAIIAAKDPYWAAKIASGRSPLIEPNWYITSPGTLLGDTVDFVARITGAYSPFSIIPGDYFSPVQPSSFLNQTINRIANRFGFPNVLPVRKTSSDVFLNYTGEGTKKLLFGSLALNKFAPDYRTNFINQLGLFAPKGNYYIGSRTTEPLDIVSPPGQIPVDEYGREIQTNVYGPSVLGKLYENETDFKFGLNSTSTINGGGLQGGFTWVSPKYKGNAGFKVGKGSDPKGLDPNYQPIAAQYTNSESTQYDFKEGSILDDTQRLINSQPNGGKRLQHVGNAIDQVSKVFNDGYQEITKGSRVVRYVDENGVFRGVEYGRVFAKDIPYYENTKLQKTDGNIRKNPFSILDKTYNLNIYPTTGPDSTTIVGGQVKKYMLSIENLAWRTSRRKGLTYADLPASEKGPNGGRIMWFPPYGLTFSDDSTVSWEGNSFLGRPEEIYTYKGTTRGGSLGFKIVVDHPSVMNLVVNNVLSNTNSNQLADQVLDSFFAGLTKFDIYELANKYKNFSPNEIQNLQDVINNSSNPEKIKDAVKSNLNRGGDGAGGSMTSNSTVGIQDYKPQLTAYINGQFYFNYNQAGGNSYGNVISSYENDSSFETIQPSQQTEIKNSLATLQNLSDGIKSILQTNPNIKINVSLRANTSYNEASNVQTDRNNCIEESILSIVGKNPNLTFTKINGPKDEKLPITGYDCSSAETNNYLAGPVGCRRVLIEDITEIPLPNTNNPNGAVTTNNNTVGNISSQNTLNNQLNRLSTSSSINNEQTISKQVLRKLLSENTYFEFLKETNPYVYDSLREKLKYFHPAFHSMTPEGLNERLTFLLQCTRPGDTIPTKQADGTFLDKDARNTAFGAPPVCVIRIGDFYHTKAIIENIKFSYEDGGLDMNPEGIGVQPMIVNVTISFKFIGGQSLRGPIEELQNALSFNFFANTEMYDERATVLDVSAYDREFIEETEPTGETIQNSNLDLSNEAGDFIGKQKGKLDASGLTGNLNYKDIMEELIDSFEDLYDGTYDKLKQVFTQYNWLILQLYGCDRTYKNGNLVNNSKEIFGKSNNYKTKIDGIFTDLLNDINNGSLGLFTSVITGNTMTTDLIKQQLTNLVNNKKETFYDGLDTITNQLSQSQLPYVRIIDKLNFVSGNVDGLIDKSGIVKIYDTTDTQTITDLITDADSITKGSQKIIDELIFNEIIETLPNYSFDQLYYFGNPTLIPLPDRRFYTIFGDDILDNFIKFKNEVIGSLNTKPYNKYIESYLDGIKTSAEELRNKGEKKFKDLKNFFPKYNSANLLPTNYNTIKNTDRETPISFQTPQDSAKQNSLKELYSGKNSTGDKFNLKFTF